MSTATASAPPRYRIENIPAELRSLDRWCVTQVVPQPDRTTRKSILVAGTTGGRALARSSDPKTWRSFAEAERDARVRGLWPTFVFDTSLPYFFIDVDDVIDPVTGEIAAHAARLIERLDTYTEYGLSGDGYHIIGRGTWKPNAANTTPPVECYPRPGPRFCIFTGNVVPGHETIEERQAQLDGVFPERIGNTNGSTESSGYSGPAGAMSEAEMAAVVAWAKPFWVVGKRHPLAVSLGGYLAKSGVPEDQAVTIIQRLAVDVRDADNVVTAVRDSYADLRVGGAVSGWRGLRDKVGIPEADLGPLSATLAAFRQRHNAKHETPWPERRALPDITPRVPTLPAAMVPEPLRPWLVAAADRIKVPLEMPTVSALGAIGCVAGRQVGIRPSEYDEFTTVPNHWALVVARSGHMKTDSIKEGFRPVRRLIVEARRAHEEHALSVEGKAARIEAELKAIKRRMDMAAKGESPKEGQPVEGLEHLETEFANKSKELKDAVAHERRYYTQDTTVEKLGDLLQRNPRGMTILRDELSGWLQALGKPGREGDREFYLEGWNGVGSFTVDRIARGTIHIPAHTISIVGGIQPGKLQPLLDSAINGGSGDDGLMQRFQLLVWPDRLPEWCKPTGWGDPDARSRADHVYAFLDTIDADLVGAQAADIPYVRYSPGAQVVADTWRDALERRLRSGELDGTPAYATHLSKYRSLLPSLALTFYLIELAGKTPGVSKGTVGEQHVRLAADWCEFLEAHARKVYAAEIQAGVSATHALAAKILAGAVFDGQSVRELYRAQWAGLRTSDLVLASLTDLTNLGWLRVDTEHPMGGGRPSQIIRLHPELADPSNPRSETTCTPDEREDTGDA